MTPSALERLRPAPARPDPTWSARTLDSILRSTDELSHEASPATTTRLVLVGARPGRVRPGARRPVALAAAAVVLVAGGGIGVELWRHTPRGTLVAEPVGSPTPAEDDAWATDVGPLSAALRTRLVDACGDAADPSPVARVHYARETSDGSGQAVRTVAVVEDRRGEYRLCVGPRLVYGVPSTEESGYGPGVLGPGGDLSPSSSRPLSLISTHQYGYERRGDAFVDVHLAVAFAVTPDVDRVEVRLSGAGADGRWFAGSVHGGFAYIPLVVAELEAPDGTPDVVVESRGYAADGRLVATDQQDHLAGTRDSHGDEHDFWLPS